MQAAARGQVLLKPGATRLQVIEELVHHGQHVRARYLLPEDTARLSLIQVQRELEAQNTLLSIAKRQGWTAEEIARIEPTKVFGKSFMISSSNREAR